ncbi:MAG: efflux RND transporter periplasmic adaptor subunit [Myxococcaceae bacterium]
MWRLVALVCLSPACRPAPPGGPDASVVTLGEESLVEVSAGTVQSGPTLSGTLSAAQSAVLRAEVAGTVETFSDRGQPVTSGQVLARIESPALRSQLESARTAARAAQAGLELARLEEARARRLEEAGSVAQRDLDLARQNRVTHEAELAEARARMAATSDQLDRATLRAPFDGVVSDRTASTGDIVAPGAALFTVVDPTLLTLEASVPSEQIADLEVGAPVDFSMSGHPGQLFEGKVDRINPAVDPATRQVRLYASVPNEAGALHVGLFATGRVATQTREGLVLPFDAVDPRGATPTVLRLREGRTERVPVELGLRDEFTETVEVLSGLSEGDRVLRGPARTTAEGGGVEVRSTPRDAGAGRPGAHR